MIKTPVDNSTKESELYGLKPRVGKSNVTNQKKPIIY